MPIFDRRNIYSEKKNFFVGGAYLFIFLAWNFKRSADKTYLLVQQLFFKKNTEIFADFKNNIENVAKVHPKKL